MLDPYSLTFFPQLPDRFCRLLTQFLDYKHDNAATIKGMLDDAAGNWASSDQADSCAPRGNQAAGATDATCSVQDQVR